MLANFKRILNFALTDFFRHKGMSVAAIFVLTITILLVTSLFMLRGASNYLIETVRNKIDITAYFKEDAQEQEILNVKEELLKEIPSIKNVQYVSKENALADFNEKHQDDSVIADALVEVGGNPFLPSLNITTNGQPAEYETIANILQRDQFSGLIEKVDFSEKKDTIEKVFSITRSINQFGIIVGAILFLVALMVVFNTIKLIIENSKEEINTMRIVGASSWFIKAPFIAQGGLFGLIAFILSFIATFILIVFASPGVLMVMPGFNLLSYLMSNLPMLIAAQIFLGVGLGVVASFIVVRKYLAN